MAGGGKLEANGEEPLRILHEDEALLAVVKPAWMLVHRGLGRDRRTLVDLVREWLGAGRVHPVHRLDRQTSGVVLFARSKEVASALQRTFEHGLARKTYLALVRGVAPEEAAVERAVPNGRNGARVPARSTVRRLAAAQIEPRAVSLVACEPHTGRYHQLRRHLRHLGHPVLMDANYGPTRLNRAFRERWGLSRLMLHAWRLELPHPASGAPLALAAPLPPSFEGPLRAMGLWPLPTAPLAL